MISNLRFHLKLSSRGYKLARTFDLNPKSTILLFTYSCFPRFTWIVPLFRPVSEWYKISYLSFLCLIMRVGKVIFLKFRSKTAFSKQGYFCHFSKFLDIFKNRSPLPIFHILKVLALSKCGNQVLFSWKSYFIIENVHNFI